MVFAGMLGSIIFGTFLDRTHKYKETSLAIFALSTFCMIGYTFLIRLQRISIQFIFFTLLGFFMTGYLPVGFDFGAEITYPVQEAMSGSLLNTSAQVFSIILTSISSLLLQKYGDYCSNIFFCVILALATILLAFIKGELKRSNISDEDKPD